MHVYQSAEYFVISLDYIRGYLGVVRALANCHHVGRHVAIVRSQAESSVRLLAISVRLMLVCGFVGRITGLN